MISGRAFPFLAGAAAVLSLVLGRVLDSTFLNLFGVLLFLVAFITHFIARISAEDYDRNVTKPTPTVTTMFIPVLFPSLAKIIPLILLMFLILSSLVGLGGKVLGFMSNHSGFLFITGGICLFLKCSGKLVSDFLLQSQMKHDSLIDGLEALTDFILDHLGGLYFVCIALLLIFVGL